MAAPQLTDEQRLSGAAKSLEVRKLRADIKQWLTEGGLNLRRDRLELALQFPATQGMRVRQLLLALPGIGPNRAAKILDHAGIKPASTVRSMGHNQRAALLAQFK